MYNYFSNSPRLHIKYPAEFISKNKRNIILLMRQYRTVVRLSCCCSSVSQTDQTADFCPLICLLSIIIRAIEQEQLVFAPHLLILNLTSCHILHHRHGQGSCSPSTHLIPLAIQWSAGNVFMG